MIRRNKMELEGKIALVTGAGGGGPGRMGKGCAMVFAREGADIVVNEGAEHNHVSRAWVEGFS
jgi:NAD(P)-dependent dehydrogenase (short-subunit alcohol dehydrogenase family)